MNTPIILGVDPGKTGALAGLDAATGQLIWVEDMPDPLTGAGIADILANEIVVAAWVELQSSRPAQSSSSGHKAGINYGILLGALGALRVGYEVVTPASWKKAAGLSKDKNESRARATQLWPESSALFARVKDDGRAESALVARHGWLVRNGERVA